MKKIVAVLSILSVLLNSQDVHATESVEMIKGYATAYCQSGTMASGQETRAGVCAGAAEYDEMMVILYQRLPDGSVGDYIGMYECLDTGGTEGLNKGIVIDVWQPDMDEVQSFMDEVYKNECKGKVYIQLVEAKG